MGRILAIAILVLPIVIFLALFSDDVMALFTDTSDTTSDTRDDMMDTATEGPQFGQ